MKIPAALMTVAVLELTSPARAQPAAFDGVWAVTVDCPAAADAAGYTLRFPARISGGELSGENLSPGLPGYLRLAGHVQPDGTALLSADGLVGNPRVAVGRVPTLTPYHYNAPTRFTASHGAGTRSSVRACTLDFIRS